MWNCLKIDITGNCVGLKAKKAPSKPAEISRKSFMSEWKKI